MATNWMDLTTADLPAATRAGESGLAGAFGTLARRDLARQSANQETEKGLSQEELLAQGEENEEVKKKAVLGDIGSLAGLGLSFIPGVGPVAGAMLPGLVGNIAGSPTPTVTGLTGLARGLASRYQFDRSAPMMTTDDSGAWSPSGWMPTP